MSATTDEAGREGLAEQAKSQLGDVAATAQDKAGELGQQGKSKLASTIDERTNQVGSQAKQLAKALRSSGSQLQMQGDSDTRQVAGLTNAAAERVDRLGGYLQGRSGDDLVRDAEEFARRRPWIVGAIGLAAGLAASRFLKASSERRYGSYQRLRGDSPYYVDRYSSATAGPAGTPATSGSYAPEG
jgi:ElaB/YqjD/DUF883 family membrane-anchored ribosome-binding protein